VRFGANEINAAKLNQLIRRSDREVSQKNCTDENISPDLRLAWWFLAKNTRFMRHGIVEIHFGAGRSSHTWRDLQGTLETLRSFVVKNKRWRFIATDESDGHREQFNLNVDFAKEYGGIR